MYWDVTEVQIIRDRLLRVRFEEGVEGFVEFLPTFFRGVFSKLSDRTQFELVAIEDGVVMWPGELDLAPDAMHHEIKIHGKWILD